MTEELEKKFAKVKIIQKKSHQNMLPEVKKISKTVKIQKKQVKGDGKKTDFKIFKKKIKPKKFIKRPKST